MPDKDFLPSSPNARDPFRLGDWQVFPAQHRLLRGSESIQVEPRIMHVLVCLASRPGEVITREAFLDAVWPEAIVVEKGLTNIISELRRILGDEADHPRYIETIRKAGYRLVATVEPLGSALADAALDDATPRPSPIDSPTVKSPLSPAIIGIAALIAAVVIAVLALRPRDSSLLTPPILQGRPLTTDPGFEIYPALSADGNWVAYCASADGRADFDLFIKPCRAQSALRLTDDPSHDLYPTWAPDGSTVAFVRVGENYAICTVPAIGGPVRRLLESEDQILGLSWSPDGREIAYGGAPTRGAILQIMILDPATTTTRLVNVDSAGYRCAFDPRFSPDGQAIAFTRSDLAGLHDLHIVAAAGGESRRLTWRHDKIAGLDWLPDGNALVFAASHFNDYQLWSVDVSAGSIRWLPTRGERVVRPTLARQKSRLVFEEGAYVADIWQQPLPTGTAHSPPKPGTRLPDPVPLIASTRSDFAPRLSPQGDQIAFISTRTGTREIWVADRNGGNASQLTNVGGPRIMCPRWSADGTQIGFSCVVDGCATLHITDCSRAATRTVRPAECHEILNGWSRDGEWLYCEHTAESGWELWRIATDGSAAQQIPAPATYLLHQSGDGRHLYCYGSDNAGIWRFTPDAAEQVCVVPGDIVRRWSGFAVLDGGVYYMRPGADQAPTLGWRGFDNSHLDSLTTLPKHACSIAAAADGSAILFECPRQFSSDLTLVDDLAIAPFAE